MEVPRRGGPSLKRPVPPPASGGPVRRSPVRVPLPRPPKKSSSLKPAEGRCWIWTVCFCHIPNLMMSYRLSGTPCQCHCSQSKTLHWFYHKTYLDGFTSKLITENQSIASFWLPEGFFSELSSSIQHLTGCHRFQHKSPYLLLKIKSSTS